MQHRPPQTPETSTRTRPAPGPAPASTPQPRSRTSLQPADCVLVECRCQDGLAGVQVCQSWTSFSLVIGLIFPHAAAGVADLQPVAGSRSPHDLRG
jgi:hypothetical protein